MESTSLIETIVLLALSLVVAAYVLKKPQAKSAKKVSQNKTVSE